MTIANYLESIQYAHNMKNISGNSLYDELLSMTSIWSNDACKGYCAMAMQEAGHTKEEISQVLDLMGQIFEEVSTDQAEKKAISFRRE